MSDEKKYVTINIGFGITIAGLILTIFLSLTSVARDLGKNEQKIAALEYQIDLIRGELKEQRKELLDAINKVGDKVDRRDKK